MEEKLLDVALVPAGLLLLLLYHARLLYLLLFFPLSTVIGVNTSNRKVWVTTMMAQDGLKNGVLAVQTLRNNIMASTLLATAAITLCSVLAVLVSSSGSSNLAQHNMILLLGDHKSSTTSVKLLCIFVCFLVAFLCNLQSVRYYSHVSFLINIPVGASTPGLTSEYVNKAMVRGGQFWSMGLRCFYFSLPMLMWLFGPIPMFVCSLALVTVLHFLDTATEFKKTPCLRSQNDVVSALPN